uniref:Uncharacterized protein n=1 Tax=Cannabis sativa TaxID=3483 RepID=A0A803PWA8_CANSA
MASSSTLPPDFEDSYSKIQLEEEEEGTLVIDFLSMQHTMASLWQPGKGMFVKELQTNLYLFQFYHEADIERVIEGSPWTFNKFQLVFERLKKGEEPMLVKLCRLDIWVQLHNLRPGFMSDSIVQRVANYIGSYVKSDPKNFNGIWRTYLRVRVSINVEKPLKRRMKLKKPDGDWLWTDFKYEFIPTFCFICGIIGHSERFCSRLYDTPLELIQKPYGLWMKEEPKWKNKLIGARWLRTGTAADAQFADNVTAINAPTITPTSIQGLQDKNTTVEGDFAINSINHGLGVHKGIAKDQGIALINANKEILAENFLTEAMIIVDSKKRRLGQDGKEVMDEDEWSTWLFMVGGTLDQSFLQEAFDKIKGIRVANGAPFISHMLFADDSYVFCRANENDSTKVLTLLKDFERASGQMVNFSKSSVFFSANIHTIVRMQICQRMGIVEADDSSLYLGLPCIISRNKKAVFGFLKDKMSQALPNHAMSVFLLPINTCKSVESVMSNYWWKSSKNNCGISWMSWKKLCKHKSNGGLGFKDLRDYNLALLGKQAWRLLVADNSLVSRVFKARYFASGSVLTASLGNNPSYVWRSIFETKQFLLAGVRKSIARGLETSILDDPWLPDGTDPYVRSVNPDLVNKKVSSLMCMDRLQWDNDILEDIFDVRDRDLILNIPLPETVQNDCWTWSREKNGVYSVKSAYRGMQEHYIVSGMPTEFWSAFWKINVQPKVLQFGWRALTGTLATKVQLNTKHVPISQLCTFCNVADETIQHILVDCSYARSCWHRSSVDFSSAASMVYHEWFQQVMVSNNTGQIEEALMVTWAIWNARNQLLWNQKSTAALDVVLSARSNLYQWQSAQQNRFDPLLSSFEIGKEVEHWTKPVGNKIKVNVDGAIFEAYNSFGFGFLARDTFGAVLGAAATSNSGSVAPEIVELIGIKEALSWIKTKSWNSVEVETDCLMAVQAINNNMFLPSTFGMLVHDCQHLLSELSYVTLSFVKRSANKAAHFLARSSYYMSDRTIDASNLPSELVEIVMNDFLH